MRCLSSTNLRNLFSVIRKAPAAQRRTMRPFRQRQILRERKATPMCGLSMMKAKLEEHSMSTQQPVEKVA
jgi:hypothetical protein